jgi:mRNA interferase MazF
MEKGDILLIPFPFSDLKGNKNRPALVLINSDLDITLAFISTQLKWKEETDILLKPTKNNGLKKESLLRLAKLATIDKNLALGRIGRMDANALKQVNINLIKLLKLDRI